MTGQELNLGEGTILPRQRLRPADSPTQQHSRCTCWRSGMSLSEINGSEGRKKRKAKAAGDKAFVEQRHLVTWPRSIKGFRSLRMPLRTKSAKGNTQWRDFSSRRENLRAATNGCLGLFQQGTDERGDTWSGFVHL